MSAEFFVDRIVREKHRISSRIVVIVDHDAVQPICMARHKQRKAIKYLHVPCNAYSGSRANLHLDGGSYPALI